MLIKAGFDIEFLCSASTPMLLMLSVDPKREADLLSPDDLNVEPHANWTSYIDSFGNRCYRLNAAPGVTRLTKNFIIQDNGLPDAQGLNAGQHEIADLPSEALQFLLGSRYCETDCLNADAWRLFGSTEPGWTRVQAICDFVHNHIRFDYGHARATRTALDAFHEKVGVCRDFAHLAVTFCRCMNIPARYCTGYLGDIGVPRDPAPMDFSAWFEAYIGGRWYAFDARHNVPRIGRIVMARGRDATDVAIANVFGNHRLDKFVVWTDQVDDTAGTETSSGKSGIQPLVATVF